MTIIDQILDLRAQGKSWRTIGRHVGKTETWCRRRAEAECSERGRKDALDQKQGVAR
jgi:hypothetical protein